MEEEMLNEYAVSFIMQNYDYTYLAAMLDKGKRVRQKGTLITGSSHALNGIDSSFWDNAVNCSMHSQDIYYDYLCAKHILENGGRGYKRCFIVLGYYIAYQDLSNSLHMRESGIKKIYYPLFKDAHHWEYAGESSLWDGMDGLSDREKRICKDRAVKILSRKDYYVFKKRVPFFDSSGKSGKTWAALSDDEREAFGKERAQSHNKHIKYVDSLAENTELLRDYIHYLTLHDILPIIVVTPFSKEYNRFIDLDMKASLLGMLDSVKDEVHFIDFNDTDYFDERDFVDTDHLNAGGAQKVSQILVELFGR